MSERRDKGGNLVTNYSKSSMDPERARRLNNAELDYVNGIFDEDTQEMTWPSYPQLAEKHEIPLRVVQEQAGKHRWTSRREQRKAQMIAFRNEQTRKRWLEEDRIIMDVMMNNVARSAATINRLLDEHGRLIDKAIKEEKQRRDDGEEDPIVRVPIRASEAEALLRASKTGVDTMRTMMERAAALPTVLPEIAPPTLIKTVEQEEQEQREEVEAQMPKATVLDIYKEIRAIEEARNAMPKVIYGELEEDDDEDEGGSTEVNAV